MPNYFYVQSGGTASGATVDASGTNGIANTLLTGAWSGTASEFFDNIDDAVNNGTNSPVAGDFIIVASDHNHGYTSATTFGIASGVTVMTVSTTNRDQYEKSVGVTTTSGEYTTNGILRFSTATDHTITVQGLTLSSQGSSPYIGGFHSTGIFKDCTILVRTAGRVIGPVGSNGSLHYYENCDIDFGAFSGCTLEVDNASRMVLFNCTVNGGEFKIDINNGGSILATGCDLSGVDSDMFPRGDLLNDDLMLLEINRCKLPASATFGPASGVTSPAAFIDVSESGNGDEQWYFFQSSFVGTAEADTTTYLNATYDGTTGFSAALSSSAEASVSMPLRYKLATMPAQDLTTAKTVTVECTSDASLTDNDIWIEVEVNDNTDEALGVVNSTQNSDPLAAGTALTTTGTGTWTSGDTEDYIITYDIGAQSNVDNGNVTVYGCVGKANIDVNFDLPTIAAT